MKRHIFRPVLIAALALLVAAPAALALPTVNVSTLPAKPVPGDTVQILISGDWPDGCVPEQWAEITTAQSGNAFTVTLSFVPFYGPCTTAVTPYKVTVPAGKLAEGTYDVTLQQTRALQTPIVLGTGQFKVAVPLVAFWVPGVLSGPELNTLASSLALYNNGEKAAVLRALASFDTAGTVDLTGSEEVNIPTGTGLVFATPPVREGQTQHFFHFAVSPGVVIRPALERIVADSSMGKLTLPLFTQPVPAGTKTIAGDTALSAAECIPPYVARRLNVTLLNLGKAEATFVVKAVTSGGIAGPGSERPVDPVAVVVPAGTVRQINGLPLDTAALCDHASGWVEIAADQPYLAYVSTVRPDTLKVLPYEVLPARAEQ